MPHHRHRVKVTIAFTTMLIWNSFASLSMAEHTYSRQTIGMEDVTRGSLLINTNQSGQYLPAPILQTRVRIDVTGLIARGTVTQAFTNPGNEWAEGVYVFPLPETAAVDHLRMIIGDRHIEGKIQERELAKETYATARKQGRRTSLLEQERPNIFTASVANIGPGETVSIEIEYQDTLRFNQNRFSLRFPLVVGPRYIPGFPRPHSELSSGEKGDGWAKNTAQVPDASRITPWVQHPDQELVNPVSIEINLLAGFPLTRLTSSYHEIECTQNRQGEYSINLKHPNVPSDRDFELIWETKFRQTPQAAIFSETTHDQTYSLIMLLPPTENLANHITQGREVIFVIDTSGSMHGTSIEQAKAAVALSLRRLTSRDRVNIIQFNTRMESLFPMAKAATQHTIQKATSYVSGLIAEGGTEMLPALRKALQVEKETLGLRQVIFITDGQIGNEIELFQVVQQQLRTSRLFTIGIGSAPNSYFMRKAAEFGRGTFTYIGNVGEVQDRMEQFFKKVEHPAMYDIQVQTSTSSLLDQIPARVQDLYMGDPVTIAMATPQLPPELTIRGQVGRLPWQTTLSLKTAKERKGIAVYWARQKIESLMNLHRGDQPSKMVRQQIIDLALQHHLVSRYTSLVAVDVLPARSSGQSLFSHAIKINLPHGQDYAAIFGLAQGATSGRLHLFVGLFFLISAYGLYRVIKNPI